MFAHRTEGSNPSLSTTYPLESKSMDIVGKHLAFVKDQQAIQEKLARKYEAEPWRCELHLKSAQQFMELADDIAKQQNAEQNDLAEPVNGVSRPSIFLTLKDIEGLPDDLVKELSFSESDKLEFTIAGIIDEAGGVLSLDKILVGIYYKTKEIVRRNILISRLYRMAQKGVIFPVPGKKGVYSTRQITDGELKRLFGQDVDAADFE